MPFGYELGVDGNTVEDSEQQALVNKIVVMRKKSMSLRTISDEIKSPGHVISHVTVGRVVRDNP